MPLACDGQTDTHRIQPMQSWLLLSFGLSADIAPVGHWLAQTPHSVQSWFATGKGPLQPCLYGRLPGNARRPNGLPPCTLSRMALPKDASSPASAASGLPAPYIRQMLCSALAATAGTKVNTRAVARGIESLRCRHILHFNQSILVGSVAVNGDNHTGCAV